MNMLDSVFHCISVYLNVHDLKQCRKVCRSWKRVCEDRLREWCTDLSRGLEALPVSMKLADDSQLVLVPHFQYVTRNVLPSSVDLSVCDYPGCSCILQQRSNSQQACCCIDLSCRCVQRSGAPFYDVSLLSTYSGVSMTEASRLMQRRIDGDETRPIFECNSNCACNAAPAAAGRCAARLVQRGISAHSLQVLCWAPSLPSFCHFSSSCFVRCLTRERLVQIRWSDSKGLGVLASSLIPCGAFITTYISLLFLAITL